MNILPAVWNLFVSNIFSKLHSLWEETHIQRNLTVKTKYGTSWNSLNIEVVSILSHHFPDTNIFFTEMGVTQLLKTYYLIKMER